MGTDSTLCSSRNWPFFSRPKLVENLAIVMIRSMDAGRIESARSDTQSNSVATRQMVFDYDRTVIAFHGTRRSTADSLVAGAPFGRSENDDDWLGHGVYFWEYAPQQAWWWAKRRYADDASVVGALIRLGRCIDLLDPSNADLLTAAHQELEVALGTLGQSIKNNANTHKYRDCAVYNYLFTKLEKERTPIESTRAVFVPLEGGKGLPRLWERSGIFRGAHIQLSIRQPNNILAVWPVREDGRYGKDQAPAHA
jgi:hypothetical protein